ncbi:bacteriocin immunity protein [Streptococcus infantarius]|uniref:bacteriocin immunity protein n=1 Tax=Streptococcus infantarius TaxID=102684 RepID=UPI001BD9815B|nr:bacteriocin immunity protein [Streptococcus infantarius]MBT0903508.1 bacteriocin immunity protein [Streptococcus infantarius subsp. infantarius]MBT0918737.1 bacteriocin immunity protein [Streptococcus infantarius subsp. infantarius]MCO4465856.1 putative bacteriocin immunity protein [Streptococcus infantarius subsp. infantarius]MCO4469845.1 putative bacteriocin immunity protein [Streptococcus infantarius subsp. infantarius]MCO4482215.1 putative bacteriocin immunity protein [Streptococcus inf
MVDLKWFSGGKERKNEAVVIIDELLVSLGEDSKYIPLKKFFLFYRKELESSGTSTPLVLSRMNVELSNILVENKLQLSDAQSKQLKRLRSLSNIRYGY